MSHPLPDWGHLDLFLIDQLLKQYITTEDKILDVGCGEGRNALFFLKEGYDIHGVDVDSEAIRLMHLLQRQYQPHRPEGYFQQADAEHLLYPNRAFSVVMAYGILHFARDKAHFQSMLKEMQRVLSVGGKLLIKVLIDPERAFQHDTRFQDFFLLDEEAMQYLQMPAWTLLEPPRTFQIADRPKEWILVLEKTA